MPVADLLAGGCMLSNGVVIGVIIIMMIIFYSVMTNVGEESKKETLIVGLMLVLGLGVAFGAIGGYQRHQLKQGR